jgi:site-specific DNA recombinase
VRAAIYLRVSTISQTGGDHVSLSVQEETCRAYVARAGGEVVVVLRDEGRSGLDTERPAYLQLFELALAGSIDVVVAYRLDRFGRDAAELLDATKRLKRLGVVLQSATEPTESNLVAGILALLAEDESARIRQRTVPAMLRRINEGKWVGVAPLGYDVIPAEGGGRTLHLNADAWKITRLFDVYAEGKVSLRALSREALMLDLRLDRTQLSRLLRNPAYLGRSVWGRREKLAPRKSRQRKRSDWYEADGQHEALVDQATFDAVQRMLGFNRERQGPPTEARQLLIGRLRCSACGAPMYAQQRKTSRYPDKVYHSYKCPRKHDGSGCAQPTVATWMLDNEVKRRVSETFVLGTTVERRRAEQIISAEQDTYLDGLGQRKQQLERSLRRQEADQRSLTRKFARGVVSERLYTSTMLEIEGIAASIRHELEDLQDVRVPDVGAALRLAASIDWSDLEKEDWREIIAAFTERIEVNGKALNIIWAQEARALARILETVTA